MSTSLLHTTTSPPERNTRRASWLTRGLIVAMMAIGISSMANAQPTETINLGIRLTHLFDDTAPIRFGLEASWTRLHDNGVLIHGPVVSFDWLGQKKRLHIGYEGSALPAGLDIGPSFIFENDEAYVGFTVSGYLGLFGYGQYSVTTYSQDTFHEVGAILKAPIVLKGSL